MKKRCGDDRQREKMNTVFKALARSVEQQRVK